MEAEELLELSVFLGWPLFLFQGRLGHQLDQGSHLLLSHPCFTETLSSFPQDGITVVREVLRKNLWKLHFLKNITLISIWSLSAKTT